MKGRKPKPTHLRVVEGNRENRPLNAREAPVKRALPAPPPFLAPEAKLEWKRISEELYNIGLLSNVDRAALAAYCQAYARWSQAEQAISKMGERDLLTGGLMIKTTNGNAIQNPLVGTANQAMAAMMRFAAEFGMTPSARSRIAANPPEDQDEGKVGRFFA